MRVGDIRPEQRPAGLVRVVERLLRVDATEHWIISLMIDSRHGMDQMLELVHDAIEMLRSSITLRLLDCLVDVEHVVQLLVLLPWPL